MLVIPQHPAQNDCDLDAMFRERCWDPVDILLHCAGGEFFRQAHAPSVVKNDGVVLTFVDAWPVQEPKATAEQGILGGKNRGLRSRFVAVNPDGAVVARIAKLVEKRPGPWEGGDGRGSGVCG